MEAYEDSGLHWREVPLEVRFMRIVEQMSAIYRLWWKNLGWLLKMRSLEFEAFRQKYATQIKAQPKTPDATTPTTSAYDHYL